MKLLSFIILFIYLLSCGPENNGTGNGNSYGFPPDFPLIMDTGGQGAGSYLYGNGGNTSLDKTGNRAEIQSSSKRVVILIHGNAGTHKYWTNNGIAYGRPYISFRNLLLNNGYSEALIWAVSYQGQGGTFDTQPIRKNIDDIRNFIDAVIEYTGVSQVDIIALSFGCSLARGYVLGFQSNGSFKISLRRLTKVGSMILMSGCNYGLGKNLADPDWNSNSPLYDLSSTNNFVRYDGSTNLTPGSIHYYCIYAAYDFPQYDYNLYGGGHALNPVNVSRLGSAPYFEIPDSFSGTFTYRAYDASDSDPLNNDSTYLYTNHIFQGWDTSVFTGYVLPNLNQ